MRKILRAIPVNSGDDFNIVVEETETETHHTMEIVGFYYGEITKEDTLRFANRKLKVTFDKDPNDSFSYIDLELNNKNSNAILID